MNGLESRKEIGGAASKSHSSGDTSAGGGGGGVSSHPFTPRESTSKMGGEQKCLSSSREMRNMAEKMRRDKLNNYINELAGIVPLGSGATKRIDKTSVLRLSANYIRMHKVLPENDDGGSSGGGNQRVGQVLGGGIAHSLAEAMGGFLLVVTSTGKVVYVTEAVNQFFGHSQVDLLGHSVYNVIHPDDHEIFQQQLHTRDNNRRSFFCRMMEKALSRNDPGRYEIIHIVGHLRPIPSSTPTEDQPELSEAPTITTDHDSDGYNSDDEDGGWSSRGAAARLRMGTHILVSFVRVVKDRPITELSLVESTQDEYITRHGMDSKILYTDHRISFVTGLMPGEVMGMSAFNYMHPDDMLWSIVAQGLMFSSTQGQGVVTYRLKCRDGKHISLRSRGYLEVNKQTGQVESFVCINTVLSIQDGDSERLNQRRKLLPIINSENTDSYLNSISSVLPPELLSSMKHMMNSETLHDIMEDCKAANSVDTTRKQAMLMSFEPSDISSPGGLSPRMVQEGSLNHNDEGLKDFNPFQSRPKRLCGVERSNSSIQHDLQGEKSKIMDETQWYNISNNINLADDFTGVVTKKFSFDRESYQNGSIEQSSSITSAQLCSPTMTMHKSSEFYPSISTEQPFDAANFTHQKFAQDCVSGCQQQDMSSLASPSPSYDSGIVSPSGNQIKEKSPLPSTHSSTDLLPRDTHDHRTLSPSYHSPQNYDKNGKVNINSGYYEQGGSPFAVDTCFKPDSNLQNSPGSSRCTPSPGGIYPQRQPAVKSPNAFEDNKSSLSSHSNCGQWSEEVGTCMPTNNLQICSNNINSCNQIFQSVNSKSLSFPKENCSLYPQGQYSLQPQYHQQPQEGSVLNNIQPSLELDFGYSSIQDFDINLPSHLPGDQMPHLQDHQSKAEQPSPCLSSSQDLSVGVARKLL